MEIIGYILVLGIIAFALYKLTKKKTTNKSTDAAVGGGKKDDKRF